MGRYTEDGYEPNDDDLDEAAEMLDDDFADPGSNSALRASSPSNPRDQPCPTCKWPDSLTRADVAHGYQCDSCANACERGGEINYYEGD